MAKKKIIAKSKYVRMSPQKVRLVVDMVRGENALYATEALEFVNKAAALPVKKTIESAIANAVNNDGLDKKELTIVEARVDEAPIYKRGRAVSKGRYHKILKRNSHIVIAVSGDKKAAKADVKSKKTDAKKDTKKEDKKEAKAEEKQTMKTNAPKPEMKQMKQAQVKSTGTQRKVQAKG